MYLVGNILLNHCIHIETSLGAAFRPFLDALGLRAGIHGVLIVTLGLGFCSFIR